jgi:type II secretory pathway predicted ATPase ExeA
MEAQFLSETVLAKHRLFRDPFAPEAIADADGKPRLMNIYLSAAHRAALMRLTQVITRAGMMALYGQPGVGKSLLRDRALHDAAELTAGKLIVVAPANIERRRMTAHHIVAELLRQLADSPDQVTPRNVNARDAMLAEVLLRLYKAGHRVILAIDEAHELPIETLKDLKRLHEVRHGYLALLGILLVGQHELRTRMDPERSPILTEVALRCTTMELGPMIERGEVRGYIAARLALVGDAKVDALFEDDAIMEIERRLGVHRQQIALQVNNCATAALNRANVLGDDRVTAEHVEDVFSATREELQRWGSA